MSSVSKKKGRYRFNVIDVILLVIVALALAAMLILALYDGDKNVLGDGDRDVELIYTVEQTQVSDILRGKINIGDSVIDGKSGIRLGQVIDVEYTDSVYSAYNPELEAHFEGLYPGKIDMRVRISVDASANKNGIYSVDGRIIGIGEEFDLRFPYYTGKALCITVSEVSE